MRSIGSKKKLFSPRGFSLIEILISITIASILLGFMTMNLLHAQSNTSLTTVVDTVTTDIKSQQNKAMTGAGGGNYGLILEPHEYILFSGVAFDPSDSKNFTVNLDSNITLSTSPTDQLLFLQQSGEITNAPFTIVVHNSATNEEKTITINKYGVITSNN